MAYSFPRSHQEDFWLRAKESVAGGNMLLSKNPNMYAPGVWPSHYLKSKGLKVKAADGKLYTDFANMSVGACTLGYGNRRVNRAVRSAVRDGNMSTLNSREEVFLAEKLIELHPWSGKARFARTGGEANAIAVRIARAFTGRDKVAISGYHGWHDWYLAANLSQAESLDGQLLPGLLPRGVPRGLTDTTTVFDPADPDYLEALLASGEYAAVKMEVARSQYPSRESLQRLRTICDSYGTLLIFDECTTGFRETEGGLHLRFGVSPDLAMFGKAMGNGYAITAVLGTDSVMSEVEKTFISSTFWTERIGPSAALATIEEMKRINSWDLIPEIGLEIKEFWRDLFIEVGLDHNVYGVDSLPTFALEVDNWPAVKTYIIQEMLSRGYLTSNAIYPSTLHRGAILDQYKFHFRATLQKVAGLIQGSSIEQHLIGDIAKSSFSRLT